MFRAKLNLKCYQEHFISLHFLAVPVGYVATVAFTSKGFALNHRL